MLLQHNLSVYISCQYDSQKKLHVIFQSLFQMLERKKPINPNGSVVYFNLCNDKMALVMKDSTFWVDSSGAAAYHKEQYFQPK